MKGLRIHPGRKKCLNEGTYGIEDYLLRSSSSQLVEVKRQVEIERLIRERSQIKKQWKTSKLSILAMFRRADLLRQKRKNKEQARIAFYKDPFKFVKSLFTEEKTGGLRVERKDLHTMSLEEKTQ